MAGNDDAGSSSVLKTLAVLEGAAKVGGAIAASGYIAMRAHYNRLGLSLVHASAERYAMEAWHFAMVMTRQYLAVLALCVFLGAAYEAFFRARLATLWTRRFERATRGSARILPALLLLAALGTYVLFRRGLERFPTDLGAGRLDAARLAGAHASSEVVNLLVGACLAYLLLSRWAPFAADATGSPSRFARQAAGWCWALLALHIPLAYGWTMQEAVFPVACVSASDPGSPATPPLSAQVTVASAPSTCGLLIAESADSVSLWRARGGSGEVVVVPTHDRWLRVCEMHDLLEDARHAAARGGSDEACP